MDPKKVESGANVPEDEGVHNEHLLSPTSIHTTKTSECEDESGAHAPEAEQVHNTHLLSPARKQATTASECPMITPVKKKVI